MEIKGSIRDKKSIVVTTGTSKARIFLTPEMVDLSEEVAIFVNGTKTRVNAKPTAETMLEDARQRGDRKRPFWVEMDLATGRGR